MSQSRINRDHRTHSAGNIESETNYGGGRNVLRLTLTKQLKQKGLNPSTRKGVISTITPSSSGEVGTGSRRRTHEYGTSQNTSRSRHRSPSLGDQTPPPVIRKRLDRPGRPVVQATLLRKDYESSVNDTHRIASRMLPPRPQSAFARRPTSSNTSLNTTSVLNATARPGSLRNRVMDISARLESSVSGYGDGGERMLDSFRRTPSLPARPTENRLGSPILASARPASASEFDYGRRLNHLSRSIREMSGSPTPSSVSSLEDSMIYRREQARQEVERIQRYELDTLDRALGERQVVTLDSMEIVRSSVSTLTDLIKAKEAELAAKRVGQLSERSQLLAQEMKSKQLEYLRQLQQDEEALLHEDNVEGEMDFLDEASPQRAWLEEGQSEITPPKRTVSLEVFPIGTPLVPSEVPTRPIRMLTMQKSESVLVEVVLEQLEESVLVKTSNHSATSDVAAFEGSSAILRTLPTTERIESEANAPVETLHTTESIKSEVAGPLQTHHVVTADGERPNTQVTESEANAPIRTLHTVETTESKASDSIRTLHRKERIASDEDVAALEVERPVVGLDVDYPVLSLDVAASDVDCRSRSDVNDPIPNLLGVEQVIGRSLDERILTETASEYCPGVLMFEKPDEVPSAPRHDSSFGIRESGRPEVGKPADTMDSLVVEAILLPSPTSSSADVDVSLSVFDDVARIDGTEVELVVSELLDDLVRSVLEEHERADISPVREWRLPNRIDSFDIPAPPTSVVVEDFIDPEKVTSVIRHCLGELRGSRELGPNDLDEIRSIDFANPLTPLVGEQMAMCLSDTFIWLLGSLPPAAAADRAWSTKSRGARNPLSSFLPQQHSVDSLCAELERLLAEHNKPITDPQERIDSICIDFMKKFCLDAVLFDYLGNSSREEAVDIEDQVIDEVKGFIEEALITSVLADFNYIFHSTSSQITN